MQGLLLAVISSPSPVIDPDEPRSTSRDSSCPALSSLAGSGVSKCLRGFIDWASRKPGDCRRIRPINSEITVGFSRR